MKHLACHQWAPRFWFRLWPAVQWSERLHPEVYPLLQWLRLTIQKRQHKNTLASYSKKKTNILGKLTRTANIKTITSNYAFVWVHVLFIPSCLSLSPRIVSPVSPPGPPAPHWTHGGAVSTLKNIPHPNPYMLEQEFSTPHQQTPTEAEKNRYWKNAQSNIYI